MKQNFVIKNIEVYPKEWDRAKKVAKQKMRKSLAQLIREFINNLVLTSNK